VRFSDGGIAHAATLAAVQAITFCTCGTLRMPPASDCPS
jgi:hypothetical protein